MNIGIYGGTFNPIHLGHMEAARFAAEYLHLDKLYLMPVGIPPHKELAEGSPTARQRLEMADLAAEELGERVEVSDLAGLARRAKNDPVQLETLRRSLLIIAQSHGLIGKEDDLPCE